MKIGPSLLVILTLVSASNCSVKYAPPKVETCIHNEDNSAECNDLRLKDGEQDYERIELKNYICTSPRDEESIFKYANDLREKLIQCESMEEKISSQIKGQ